MTGLEIERMVEEEDDGRDIRGSFVIPTLAEWEIGCESNERLGL